MLNRELHLYQNYINKKPTDTEMLENLTKLQHVTRGELFDMLATNKKDNIKKQKIIIVISVLNLTLNLTNMILLLLK